MPECARTAINTATVAFQEFPNHRVRGDFEIDCLNASRHKPFDQPARASA